MKNVLAGSTIVTLALLAGGCSFVLPHTQQLTARCSETDAILYIEKDQFVGQGTATVSRNKHVNIMCTKAGFKPVTVESTTTLSGAGMADAIGGVAILLPGIGLLSPGAWRHQMDTVNVPMEREPAAP